MWLACAALPGDPFRATAAEPACYRFGVFPYVPALTVDRIFGPMATSFAAALDRPVYLKTRSTFEGFADELRKETYDIVFVHPFSYVDAADRHGYLPLARLDGQLSAVVLVAKDRPWRSWADLAGKTLAMPPALAAVSELASLALMDVGLTPGIDVTVEHHRTKASCLQAVTVGAADACALPQFALSQIAELGDGRLRVMVESRPIKHVVFAVHPRVPEADRAALRALIMSWPQTEQGRAILAAGAWPGFVAARDADYQEVRDYHARLAEFVQR
jgi:phosphonate transport system substrate-binding protein